MGTGHRVNNSGIAVTSNGTAGSDNQGVNSIVSENEEIQFTIPFEYSGSLKYYCYNHDSMVYNFTIN